MYKKLIAFFAALFIVLTFAACSSDEKPVDLKGHWTMDPDQATPQFYMEAVVTDKNIEVTWHGEDTTSLYWKGDFLVEEPVTDGASFVSAADRNALDQSMLGSSAPNKEFNYEDGMLTFEMTVMGTTKTIRLKK